MTKTLLTAVILAGTVSSASATMLEPTCTWAELLTGVPGQDNARAIATDGDNNVFWMCITGSKTGDTDVYLGKQYLYDGANYEGTSANKNLTILKTDSLGIPQWVAYTVSGDFSNDGGISVDPDGNLIFAVTGRHTDGALDSPLRFEVYNWKDYSVKTIDWTTSRRYTRLITGSISPEGKYNWVRSCDIATTPMPAATSATYKEFTPNAISCNDVATDNEGNIYVCGNFREDLYVPSAGGKEVTLKPSNVSAWNGDSQKNAGDLFILKLDKDGYYINSLTQEGGEINWATMQNLEWHDGLMYVSGYMTGNGETAATVAGTELVPAEYVSPVAGCLDTDLNAKWMVCYPGAPVDGKNAVQNVGIRVYDNNLWMVGQYNGRISSPDSEDTFVESTQGTLREGFIIKLDAANGKWLASANSRTGFPESVLTAYLDAFIAPDRPDCLFVYGYGMNASVGIFVRGYDTQDLEAISDQTWQLVYEGGMPTTTCAAYVPENNSLYLTARGNKPFYLWGWGETANPGGYTNLLARFLLPEAMTSGVVSTDVADNGISITGGDGRATVTNNGTAALDVTLYTIAGTPVWKATIPPGETSGVALDSGIYISSLHHKIIVR